MVTGCSRCQWDDRTTHLVCGAPGPDRTGPEGQPAGGKEGMEDKRQRKNVKKKKKKVSQNTKLRTEEN